MLKLIMRMIPIYEAMFLYKMDMHIESYKYIIQIYIYIWWIKITSLWRRWNDGESHWIPLNPTKFSQIIPSNPPNKSIQIPKSHWIPLNPHEIATFFFHGFFPSTEPGESPGLGLARLHRCAQLRSEQPRSPKSPGLGRSPFFGSINKKRISLVILCVLYIHVYIYIYTYNI